MRLPLFSSLLACAAAAKAQVTIYGVFGSTTTSASAQSSADATSSTSYQTVPGPATFTGLAAYNPVFLEPPAIPNPPPANQFTIALPNAAAGMNALSIPQAPTFFGFSIEMSVATQLIGTNSTQLHVPFLNLMALMVEKAGAVHVRVGGNTQDTAFMVDSFPDGKIMEKDKEDASNPTSTPVLAFTPDLLYMLANVSSLVNCHWYLGVPFNDTANWRLEIAELGEAILGDHLLGFQAGNEPDLYGKHYHRPLNYSEWDYFGEFSLLTQAYQNDAKITNKKSLIAPSTAGNNWPVEGSVTGPEPVWNTGFVQAYDQWLSALAVERYPDENCAAMYPSPGSTPIDLISEFPKYLSHQTGLDTVSAYLNSTMLAQTWGKPFLMFETNTASCGGFMGISDAFAAALFGVDWALQLANSNFTGALFHAGGQDVAYNPFTAPPTNQSAFHQWTIGPVFYSAIVVTEALGTSNTSRVKDLFPNNGNDLTPAYAIYENDQLARMVLINFMDDPTGANDYTATVQVGGQQFGESNSVPAQVKVKYLLAPSVSEKDNITWAGQTLGGRFQVDGRWKGTESVQTVQCDQNANTCPIKVPAPGAALVFISDSAQQVAGAQESYSTFPTTVVTKTANTVSVDASVLATSNGNSGKSRANRLGGTSQGGKNAAAGTYGVRAERAAIVSALAGVIVGGMVMFTRALW